MKYSFDQLPYTLAKIEERLERIEKILDKKSSTELEAMDYIGADEARKILKISLATLYTKVYLRQIPFYKKGNRLHFQRQELLDWIKEGKKKTFKDLKEEGKLGISDLKGGYRR